MLVYQCFRIVVGVAELCLAGLIVKRNVGGLLTLALFLYWTGVSDVIPAMVENPYWWRLVWLPLAAIRLILAVAVSLELIFTVRLKAERRWLFAFAGCIAGMIEFAGWKFAPSNTFQALAILRQYALLGIAGASWSAWWYLRKIRQTDAASGWSFGSTWIAWSVVSFLGSVNTRGGLLWAVFEWKGGRTIWIAWSLGTMILNFTLIAIWWRCIPSSFRSAQRPRVLGEFPRFVLRSLPPLPAFRR